MTTLSSGTEKCHSKVVQGNEVFEVMVLSLTPLPSTMNQIMNKYPLKSSWK